MSNLVSREVRLKQHPEGMPTQNDFEIAEVPVSDPADGEVLIRNIWMSVDPYMRGRMTAQGSGYVAGFKPGQVLEGGAIGQVVKSRNPNFKEGQYVNHMQGWREAFLSDGAGLSPIDPSLAPVQLFLGTLGMPGLTAYVGLLDIGQPKPGETVFVSAASGAVGSVVSQIAKIKGCRVVGSAGSDDKCAWLKDVAGVDEAINYKSVASLDSAVGQACPNGIDIYFENVGGAHLEAALNHMNDFGRLPLCGMIGQYNATDRPSGPYNIILAVPRRLTLKGFIVSDHFDRLGDFVKDMAVWIGEGRMKSKETVYEGIENAPKAFMALFTGDNFGKMLVKIGPDSAV